MTYCAKLEITFEMIDMVLCNPDSTARTFTRTSTQLNAGDFDGNPLFYFEIVATNSSTNTNYDVTLYDSTNAADKATCNVAANTSTTLTRIRSTSFSPASGEVVYKVKLPSIPTLGTVRVFAARIVVVQDSTATKTVIDIPMAAADYGTTSDTSWDTYVTGSYITYNTSTSWTAGNYSSTITRFYKDASKWATVSGCAINVVALSPSSHTGHVCIYCEEDSSAVSGSDVTMSLTTTPLHAYQTFNWSDMTDAKSFGCFMKGNGSFPTMLLHCSLRILMSDLQKGEVRRRIGLYISAANGGAAMRHQRQKYDSSLYTNPTLYYEVTGNDNLDNTNITSIYERNSDSSDISSGTMVTGSGLNFYNQGIKKLLRSGGIAISNGYNIACYHYATTNTHAVTSPQLVVAFRGLKQGSQTSAVQMGVGVHKYIYGD